MDDFINQLTSIANTWSSAGAIAGLILLVNLLTNLTKLQVFAKWVPAVWRARVAATLGGVGGLLAALVAGKPLPAALFSGLVIGLGAIGTHELVSGANPAVVAKLKRVFTGVAVTSMVLILGSSLLVQGCHGQCATPAEANTFVCAAENNVVDCTKPEVQGIVAQFLPIAIGLAMHLAGADGSVDWDAFGGYAKAAGWRDGTCIYQKTVDWVTSQKLLASSTPHIDQELQRENATQARMKTWPGVKVKTEAGTQ